MAAAAPIRAYEVRDRDEVLRVWRASTELAHPFLDAALLDKQAKEVAEMYLPNTDTWLAEDGGRVLAFVSVIKGTNEVGALFCDPASRGGGLGRRLMDRARESRPGQAVELDVFERNPLGRGFYEHYGFREVSRSTHEETGEGLLRLRCEPRDESK